jgi:hypothetical protein
MNETSPDELERLVSEQGAYDVVLLELDELPATLARWGVNRTARGPGQGPVAGGRAPLGGSPPCPLS